MKPFRILLFTLLCFQSTGHAQQSGMDVLKRMHEQFAKGPCQCYTFSQKNTHYRNDSVVGTSEWHETVVFPDIFKIEFGDKKQGNYMLFRNDSAYRFKMGVFQNARRDSNSLLLILGGMYYRDFKDVTIRLKKAGFDFESLSQQTWGQYKAYVIGAKSNDLKSNQIWIDKQSLKVLRIIETMGNGDTMDMRFEAHQAWCKGFVETKVSFRRNGKLEQVEEYYNLQESKTFPQ
jgi:hypothetical protein